WPKKEEECRGKQKIRSIGYHYTTHTDLDLCASFSLSLSLSCLSKNLIACTLVGSHLLFVNIPLFLSSSSSFFIFPVFLSLSLFFLSTQIVNCCVLYIMIKYINDINNRLTLN